ncbi:hypothetical protein Tco_0748057 [Tanacetum coccineum]|uniref:Uncharacterized protein n=1 Tax=Tanacetum coccineum TaxID=301880 RepID=A0ABQ4YVF6_9ASTR
MAHLFGLLDVEEVALLDKEVIKNFLLQRNSKLIVILKLQINVLQGLWLMCMLLSIIIKLQKRYGTELSFLCKARNSHYKKGNVNCLVVPVFTLRDDPIACLNKAVAFMSAIAASRFLLTNNQLRTFYNPRNQTTIQDGRVTVQQVQRREGQSYGGTGNKGNVTSSGETMHESRQGLLNAIIIKREDLDAYDSDCDDVSTAHAILMANLSNYGSYVISEVPHYEPYHNDMDNQSVHAMQDFEQTSVVDFPDNEITKDWELQSWPSILTCASLNPSQPLIVSTQSFPNNCLGSPTCQSPKTHPLHHSWLLEGGLSGINLRGTSMGKWKEWSLKVYKYVAGIATIQEGRVTVQQVQGRQGQSYAGIGYKGNATSFEGNNAGGPRNAAWFKDKAMLTEAHESGQILDKEKLAFLADPSIPDGQVAQTPIKRYVISEVPHSESYHNDLDNQSVHAIEDFKQTPVIDFPDNEITSDSNIILYSQYLQETQQATV